MGLPKIDGGCTVVAWNTRTANFFPRHNLASRRTPLPPPLFLPDRRSPTVIFPPSIRHAVCTPSPSFPLPLPPRNEIAREPSITWKISIDPITSFIPGLSSSRENICIYSREENLFLPLFFSCLKIDAPSSSPSAPFDSFINESRGETSSFCSQVRDDMAADGVEPLEEEIPHEDIIGRDYCRYNVKRPIAP